MRMKKLGIQPFNITQGLIFFDKSCKISKCSRKRYTFDEIKLCASKLLKWKLKLNGDHKWSAVHRRYSKKYFGVSVMEISNLARLNELLEIT